MTEISYHDFLTLVKTYVIFNRQLDNFAHVQYVREMITRNALLYPHYALILFRIEGLIEQRAIMAVLFTSYQDRDADKKDRIRLIFEGLAKEVPEELAKEFDYYLGYVRKVT